MLKKLIFFTLTLVLLFVVSTGKATAIVDPLASANNSFGIHIQDETDIPDAAKLVNSTGGDWGYVTFVIREDERDIARWQGVFDNMRRYHLIPIIRLATRQENGGWTKPDFAEIGTWTTFLNSLNWVVVNRYVIIGNEPNHAVEWGNEINPSEYANYLKAMSTELKATSDDFFILPAALDAAAPNSKIHMSEAFFISSMVKYDSTIFNYIDGWNSHSYPNPNFSGSVNDHGLNTIRGFIWELEYLKKLGLKKELPVFITETGWAHNSNNSNQNLPNPEALAEKYIYAFKNIWNDKRVVATTPFILNYQNEPFAKFSWKISHEEYYPYFLDVQNLPKIKGQPNQYAKGEIEFVILPNILKRDGKLFGLSLISNTGQTIWQADRSYEVDIRGTGYNLYIPNLINIEPFHNGLILYSKK